MGPAGRRRLKVEFQRIGQAALSDARSRAGSWSARIPAAITARPMVGDKVGVQLRTSLTKAPHARAYEGITAPGDSFRHPVFGTDRWVDQRTRPFLWPAVRGRRKQMEAAATAAYEAAARECGFR